jgi:hypothetical protein
MGVLFQRRPRLEDIRDLDDITLYSFGNFTNNFDSNKKYDDIAFALDAIRAKIALGPPTKIQFVVDKENVNPNDFTRDC